MKRKSNRQKWIHLRITQEEFDLLQSNFRTTISRKLSEYLRSIIFKYPVTVKYRNKSADDFLSVALQLKNELKSIGNNLNQTAKSMHVFKDMREFSALIFYLQSDQQKILLKTDEIINKMAQIYDLLVSENNPQRKAK